VAAVVTGSDGVDLIAEAGEARAARSPGPR
jgi:hypothetical protein